MQLTIKGEDKLFKRLNALDNVMKHTFWIGVQEDFDENLFTNIKPHSKSTLLERNAYVDIIKDGVEGGVRNQGGLMVTWRGRKINYGMFVEHGTRAHTIEAKNKKALRWSSGGAFAFAKSVQHPGTEASHFLERAAKKTFGNLEKIFNKELHNKGIL